MAGRAGRTAHVSIVHATLPKKRKAKQNPTMSWKGSAVALGSADESRCGPWDSFHLLWIRLWAIIRTLHGSMLAPPPPPLASCGGTQPNAARLKFDPHFHRGSPCVSVFLDIPSFFWLQFRTCPSPALSAYLPESRNGILGENFWVARGAVGADPIASALL